MPEEEKNLITRAPVVVVLGHVDSGKTSILDYIRKTNIVAKESGGITQHIGAYEIERGLVAGSQQSKKITFIDTPGHEAFSAMRARGARIADIAVLVVDTTAGVQAQTKEAIEAIKKAGIPMLVALNKMDKKEAQPEKVKGELAKAGVVVEPLGGKVPAVEVSAKTGQGIEELLDLLLLVAEMGDLKADIGAPCQGTVIESYLDAQKGPVGTLILNQGVLRVGDIVGTSSALGRVKSLTNFQNLPLEVVLPSQPSQVLGFAQTPKVGENFKVYPNLEEAQKAIKLEEVRQKKLFQVFSISEGKKVLNIILRADVLGSLEALEGILETLPQDKVILRILRAGVGNVIASDIELALTGNAEIFGFRVRMDESAQVMALQKNIVPKTFDVIYELVHEARRAMERRLEPEVERVNLGRFKITVLFKQNKREQIVGGKMLEGELTKNTLAEVIREEEALGGGKIKNLQQEKKDVGKVTKGQEAGILFEGEVKIQDGDILQIYREERKKGEL